MCRCIFLANIFAIGMNGRTECTSEWDHSCSTRMSIFLRCKRQRWWDGIFRNSGSAIAQLQHSRTLFMYKCEHFPMSWSCRRHTDQMEYNSMCVCATTMSRVCECVIFVIRPHLAINRVLKKEKKISPVVYTVESAKCEQQAAQSTMKTNWKKEE